MSSLTNRYRPKTWKDVAGHEAEILRMKGILKRGKIPNSMFFGGSTGTGKTTLARIFASYVNCETKNLCGECASCKATNKGHNPDIVEINGASARGIDDARALMQSIKYKPTNGRYKVVIIDEVQQLTTQAAQSLLTTLEEPPAHVIFMLCSMEPEKVEEALVTRGSIFNLQAPSPAEIEDRLKYICKKEKVKLSSEVVAAIAHQSQGCVRYAVQLLESCFQAYYADKDNKKIKDVLLNKVLKLGEENSDIAGEVLVAMFSGDYKGVHKLLTRVDNFPTLISKMSYLVMYQIDRTIIGFERNKCVWHTVANKNYYDALVKKVRKVNLTHSYAALDDLNDLKFRMGSFLAVERHLFATALVKRAIKCRK